MNDKRVIEAAKGAVSVIVRRPHAYKFAEAHPKASIPGLAVLDSDGKFIGAVALPSKEAVEKVLQLMTK